MKASRGKEVEREEMREKRSRCSCRVWRINKMVTVEDVLLVSALPSKGLFHFILLGHIYIKESQCVWECVGECCVCEVNAS